MVDSFECVKMHGPTNPKFKKSTSAIRKEIYITLYSLQENYGPTSWDNYCTTLSQEPAVLSFYRPITLLHKGASFTSEPQRSTTSYKCMSRDLLKRKVFEGCSGRKNTDCENSSTGVQIKVPMTHQPMASLHKVTWFLLEPFDHLGIITAVSTALSAFFRNPKLSQC